MKVVQINATSSKGSTGKICVSISELLTSSGIENYVLYSSGTSSHKESIKYTRGKTAKIEALKSRIFGNYGFNTKSDTKRLISKLERISPDIVHIHNIHSHNCNLTMLFNYLKEKGIRIVWTFHDCWAFTAYCPHFSYPSCEKWKNGCNRCPQVKSYSFFFDRSSEIYDKKRNLFTGLDLTVVTPSNWLGDLVKQSFLKQCPVKVINNGIDLNIFKPSDSDFREKYGLENKKIVLGVSFGWSKKKGIDVFSALSQQLGDDYKIVLVGVSSETAKDLPGNILTIERTQDQKALAEIYSAANIFFNPTREETYPTVNMEALACGTPVLTFNTGGSPEIIDESCGSVINSDNIEAIAKEIKRIVEGKIFSAESCLKRAQSFSDKDKFKAYLDLYKEMVD